MMNSIICELSGPQLKEGRKPTIDSSKYVIGHYKLLGEKVHHSKKNFRFLMMTIKSMTKRPCRAVSLVVWLNGKYSNAWNRTQLCIIRHVNSNVMKVQPTTGLVRRDRPRMCEFFSRQSWRKKRRCLEKLPSTDILLYHIRIMHAVIWKWKKK